MKNYKPDSWSKQARRLADNFLLWENLNEASESLKNSYRCDRVKFRALKRFARLRKKIEREG